MIYHKELAEGRWKKFSFIEQMANIGSEVARAIRYRPDNKRDSVIAAERALELLDLTIEDEKNKGRGRQKELWRTREVLADFLFFNNEYKSTDKNWLSYFDAFAYAASLEHKWD
ncbi:MAG TPA: hypothetical protein VJJ72_00805 [Candidatus Paceibacterota bacterium]